MADIHNTTDSTATPEIPAELTLADGTTIPHEIGVRVFNHYDMRPGTIERTATRPEPDTSGLLPGGLAWWIDVRHVCGTAAVVVGISANRDVDRVLEIIRRQQAEDEQARKERERREEDPARLDHGVGDEDGREGVPPSSPSS